MLCSTHEVVPSLTLFCHFYVPMSNGDWISFSLRRGLVDICDALPTFVNYWKEELFFVSSIAFTGAMGYGATSNRFTDPSPNLIPEEQCTIDLLSEN